MPDPSVGLSGGRLLAAENKDGTVVILRGPRLARLRCRRFGHPRLAKIAGVVYCPRCGAVLPPALRCPQPGPSETDLPTWIRRFKQGG